MIKFKNMKRIIITLLLVTVAAFSFSQNLTGTTLDIRGKYVGLWKSC